MPRTHHIAIDLGAESGRLILAAFDNGNSTLRLTELHRFTTAPLTDPETNAPRTNLPHILAEIHAGLAKVTHPIDTISTDAWGVDYVWLDNENKPLALPHHYRDPRNQAASENFLKKIPFSEIYAETGIQLLPFNTLYQLSADLAEDPGISTRAKTFLLIADYINHHLSGAIAQEVSSASTTQLYNPLTRTWSLKLAATLNLPPSKFPNIVPSGTILGNITNPALLENPNLRRAQVIASCSHDTASAIAAIPHTGASTDWAYLNSGTWSLLGLELQNPLLTPAALAANFTNEIGYNHTTRFLKNIPGMWLLQECRRAWAAEGSNYTYAQLQQLAESEPPTNIRIDPADPVFNTPGSMPEKIAAHLRQLHQPVPATHAQTTRAILESLATHYAQTIGTLSTLANTPIRQLHITGGGSQNTLLNQLTANSTKLPVITGPVEATAIGNILIQLLATQKLPGLQSARQLVQKNFPTTTHHPQ